MFDPFGGTQRSASQRLAALRTMDQFEALALTAENHGMVADCVTGAQRQHGNLVVLALAGDTFTTVNRIGAEIEVAGLGYSPPERESRAARRVHLGVVMNLDHLGIEVAEDARNLRGNLHQYVDADTHVGSDYRAGTLSKGVRTRFRFGSKSRRSDYDRGAFVSGNFEVAERRFRIGEVQRDGVGAGNGGIVIDDFDAL